MDYILDLANPNEINQDNDADHEVIIKHGAQLSVEIPVPF
jgi:hypothetical protein